MSARKKTGAAEWYTPVCEPDYESEFIVQIERTEFVDIVVAADDRRTMVITIFAVPERHAGSVTRSKHANFVFGTGLGFRRTESGDLKIVDPLWILFHKVCFNTKGHVEAGVDLEGKLHLFLHSHWTYESHTRGRM